MADEYKAEPGSPGGLYRQFKQTGYHPVTGEPVYAEMVSLDAGSIGGGGSNTQYAEGDTAATPTGTAALWKDTSDVMRAISAAKPLPVNVVAGGGGGGAMTVADGADVTLGAIADVAWVSGNGTVISLLKNIAASTAVHAVTNAGIFAVQAAATLAAETTKVIGVVRTADGSGNLLTATSNALDVNIKTSAASNISTNTAQINGVTPLMGAGNTGTGSQRVTIATDQLVIPISDNSGSLTVDAPLATPAFVTVTPNTTGGWAIANMTSGDTFTALTSTAQVIKASAGTLGGWYIYNPNVTPAYVNIYNIAAASVTVGTSTPALNLCIPATSAANIEFTNGITFSNAGWSASATTTGGGNTAPGTALEANFLYK